MVQMRLNPEYRVFLYICGLLGGHIQLVRQLIPISSIGRTGFSLEYTTLRCLTFLFFNSLLITLASGHTDVLYISATSNSAGLSLLPAPILLIIGVPASCHRHYKCNLSRYSINCVNYIIIF